MKEKSIRRLQPPATIGIIGGGQLGRMMALEAKRMGYHVVVFDPKSNSPAGQVSDEQIVAGYDDLKAIRALAEKVDVLTYEFEHIDVSALEYIEDTGYDLYPSSDTLKIIQDKAIQKQFLKDAGIPIADFRRVDSYEDIRRCIEAWQGKVVLKTRKDGYDGKGSLVVETSEDVEYSFEQFKGQALMVERFIPFEKEVSVVIVRGQDGTRCFPVAENRHDNGILIKTMVPADISENVSNQVESIAKQIVEILGDYGVFCIEYFVDPSGRVLVNEIAPRPHNSGHYTIEGCLTSQYEQLVRVITGMPIGSTSLRKPCVMFNILGDASVIGQYVMDGVEGIMAMEDCHLHLYGKSETQHLKKIGHITACGDTLAEADWKATEAISALTIRVGGSERMDRMNDMTRMPDNNGNLQKPRVGIIMGSDSDLHVMGMAAFVMTQFNIPYEIKVVSAHRTPERMFEYARSARERGLEVIIAGAGGAAHLPGMVASLTQLPVIGVPVKLKELDGLDALLSIVQMPGGVPVATVGINNAKNAGMLAARILGVHDDEIARRLEERTDNIKENLIYDLKEKLMESGVLNGS